MRNHKQNFTKAQHIFSQLFKSTDPFGTPFSEVLSCRAILYPISYTFTEGVMSAVVLAAREVGDEGLYLTFTESVVEKYIFVPFENLGIYYQIAQPLENVIYSPSQQWGFLFSHEDHVLVGGSERFVNLLYRNLSLSIEEQVLKFLEAWKYHHLHYRADITWLPRLLSHLFTQQMVFSLLDKAQIPSLWFE